MLIATGEFTGNISTERGYAKTVAINLGIALVLTLAAGFPAPKHPRQSPSSSPPPT